MIKVIPEKQIFICDVCNTECKRPAHSPEFIKKQDALDIRGQPVGDATWRIQPCARCEAEIASAIQGALDKIRGTT